MLLELEWNLDALVEAYIERASKLCEEPIPELIDSPNLAHRLEELYERDFDDDDLEAAHYDKLYSFNEIHSLRFWLRGADIPNIIIGCNNGVGEISLHQTSHKSQYKCRYKPGAWTYNFDMPEFQRHFHAELSNFLNHWLHSTSFEEGKARAEHLLHQLSTMKPST